ncbi:MAG: hypothetical protein EOM08_08545 [Clostridia bacterium]|nr:hypothetical protein [Clostridia bacterium]
MCSKSLSILALTCCFVIASVSISVAASATVPTPAGAVGVNHGPGGMGFPVGKFSAVLNYRYSIKDRWYTGTSEEDGLDRQVNGHLPCLKTRFGIAKGWDVRTATPFVHNVIETDDQNDRWVGGLGDTTAFLRYQFASQNQGDPLNLAVDFGAFIPTGEVGANNPGIGAWGGLLGLGATYMTGSHRLESDASYLVYTEGTKDKTKGDRLRINGHYAYALSRLLDLGLEGYYEWTQPDEVDGQDQDNDAKTLFVGPKFNLKFPDHGVIFGGTFLGAAYRDYEQKSLTEDWRAEFKLIKVF